MDRELPKDVVLLKKRKRIFQILFISGIFIISGILLRFLFAGSVNSSEFMTDKVKIGEITSTITASGTIIPEFEELFLSPISSKINKVIASAGKNVNEGDTLLVLDKEAIQLSVEKLSDELELNNAQTEKQRLVLEKSIKEMETTLAIRELRLKSLETEVQNQKELLAIGGATREEVKKAELELKIAQLEYKQLTENFQNLKETTVVELKEKQLQTDIQKRILDETKQRLNESVVVAHQKGVLTWIVDQIGSEIVDKQQLAKVSDLSSFKLKCSISDMYASKLQTGQSVLIRVNDSLLNGNVTTIMPTINNNIIDFMVALSQKFNSNLRPNMKVDIYLITNYKAKARIIKNAGFFKGKMEQYVFVKKGEIAERRLVKLGISNFEMVEIISGIETGEEVIITDMKDYENRRELKIKN